MDLTFLLNGESVALQGVDPTRSVLDWLRETRGLTGTKEGCNEGDCGACSVMITEAGITRPVNACLMMLGHLDGKALTTVEGLTAPDGTLHPVQQAMVEHHGSQCGFCTPGIVMSLATGHLYGADDFDDQLAGNLCRCTGYAPIVRAAQAARGQPVPDWFRDLLARQADKTPDPSRPRTADALAQALMERPHAVIINGASDVALWLTKGLKQLQDCLFIDGIAEFKHVAYGESVIRIGAGVSIEKLRGIMSDLHPGFAEMLRRFASAQVRAIGTVGGNIGNGSPIADTPPAFIALDTTLHLRRGDTRRSIALEDYYIEYGRQDRQPGEFIEAISVPRQPDRLRVYKLSKRFDQDISAVLGAFSIGVEDGKVTSARIAFGGMAGTPKRAANVEAALVGRAWTRETVEAAMAEFSKDFTPLTDMRGSAEYRLTAAANMLKRAWLEDQGAPVSVLEVEP